MKTKQWMLLCFFGILFFAKTACAASVYRTVLATYNAIDNGCWFCGVFGTLFDIMNDITTTVCKGMQGTFLMLLGLFMLFWLAIRVGKVVLDISPNPDTSFVPDLLKQILKVTVASLLISGYIYVFHNIVGSALELSIGVGNRIMTMQDPGTIVEASRTSAQLPVERTEKNICQELHNAIEEANSQNSTEGDKAFSSVTKEAFLCYIRTASAAMINGMALGITAALSWFDMGWMDKLRHFDIIWVGIVIYVCFFMLFVYFPVQLFDPLLNLVFVSAMYPLWMVLAVFNATKGYTNKAKDMFLSVLVHLIVISIVGMLAINVMGFALGTAAQRSQMEKALLRGEPAGEVFGPMVNQRLWVTLALGLMAFNLMKQAPKIASNFQAGVNMGGNETMGRLTGNALKLSTNAAASGISAGAHAVQGGVSRMAQRNDGLGRVGRNLQRVGDATTAAFSTGLAISTFGMLGTSSAATSIRRLAKGRPRFVDGKDMKNRKGETYTFNGKKNIMGKKDAKGNVYKIDNNTGVYESQDKYGKMLGKYDSKHQEVSLDGRNYKIHNNQVLTMDNKTVDNSIANRVLQFRKEAEDNINHVNRTYSTLKKMGKIK